MINLKVDSRIRGYVNKYLRPQSLVMKTENKIRNSRNVSFSGPTWYYTRHINGSRKNFSMTYDYSILENGEIVFRIVERELRKNSQRVSYNTNHTIGNVSSLGEGIRFIADYRNRNEHTFGPINKWVPSSYVVKSH